MPNYMKRQAVFLRGSTSWMMAALIAVFLCGAPQAVAFQDDHPNGESRETESQNTERRPAFLPHPVMDALAAVDEAPEEEAVITRAFNFEAFATVRVPPDRQVVALEDFKVEVLSDFGENPKVVEASADIYSRILRIITGMPASMLLVPDTCALFKKLCDDNKMTDVLLSSSPGAAQVYIESQEHVTNIRGAISASALETLVYRKSGYRDCTPHNGSGFVIFRANGHTFLHCDLQPLQGETTHRQNENLTRVSSRDQAASEAISK